jgi:2-polyprenyl-3-methyl-5-hydroxy-6-metoxy-1,4-benzoquinol methylase
MKNYYSSYDSYDVLKDWSSFFKPNAREAHLFKREFRGISLANKSFLDIGFGSGALLGWAMQQGAEVAGVEVQEKLLGIASNNGIRAYSDLSEIESNAYDVIASFDVLEHIPLQEW